MTIKDIKNDEVELQKCLDDPAYFAEKYCTFDGKTPLRLKDSQKLQMRTMVAAALKAQQLVISGARYGKVVIATAANKYLEWRRTL